MMFRRTSTGMNRLCAGRDEGGTCNCIKGFVPRKLVFRGSINLTSAAPIQRAIDKTVVIIPYNDFKREQNLYSTMLSCAPESGPIVFIFWPNLLTSRSNGSHVTDMEGWKLFRNTLFSASAREIPQGDRLYRYRVDCR